MPALGFALLPNWLSVHSIIFTARLPFPDFIACSPFHHSLAFFVACFIHKTSWFKPPKPLGLPAETSIATLPNTASISVPLLFSLHVCRWDPMLHFIPHFILLSTSAFLSLSTSAALHLRCRPTPPPLVRSVEQKKKKVVNLLRLAHGLHPVQQPVDTSVVRRALILDLCHLQQRRLYEYIFVAAFPRPCLEIAAGSSEPGFCAGHVPYHICIRITSVHRPPPWLASGYPNLTLAWCAR